MPGSADTVCCRPPPTLTFDHLTLKLVCESHLRWETSLPNLGPLGLWVLELFRYVRDGRTDRQIDGQTDGQKQRLLPHSLRSGHNNCDLYFCSFVDLGLSCSFHLRIFVCLFMAYVVYQLNVQCVQK